MVLMSSFFVLCSAQIVIDSKFRPFSYEELMMQAQAEAAYNARMQQLFEQYQEEAYRRYNNQDLYGFLTYSNYALETGWYRCFRTTHLLRPLLDSNICRPFFS